MQPFYQKHLSRENKMLRNGEKWWDCFLLRKRLSYSCNENQNNLMSEWIGCQKNVKPLLQKNHLLDDFPKSPTSSKKEDVKQISLSIAWWAPKSCIACSTRYYTSTDSDFSGDIATSLIHPTVRLAYSPFEQVNGLLVCGVENLTAVQGTFDHISN